MGFLRTNPIPIKERISFVHVSRAKIDVKDGALVSIDKNNVRTHIPVGALACVFLEPGTRISHRAVKLAADAGTLLVWTGDGSVRFYAAGQPGGARADRLLRQTSLAVDPKCRLNIVRHMFSLRFGEAAPSRRSVAQLRGIEGVRVREAYSALAAKYGIRWEGRKYDQRQWGKADLINRCISAANSCLYGVAEAAILAAGYSPAVGFLHTGKPRSFVYDIADLFKMETSLPAAFETAAVESVKPEREVRLKCRDLFRETRLMSRLIPEIEAVLDHGGRPSRIGEYSSINPNDVAEPKSISDPGFRESA